MKKFKQSLTLFLAVIICASFCTLNGNAAWYDFSGNKVNVSFDPNNTRSYAELDITDWATETNTTDLYAKTCAYPSDYNPAHFISVTVYVSLGVTLEEYSSYSDELSLTASSGNSVSVQINGEQFLNLDDHYEIIFFSSSHEVWFRKYTRFDLDAWDYCDPDDFQEGETIYIGFTQ